MDGRGALAGAAEPSVLVLYRDSAFRRAALAAEPGSAERYWLFGADQLAGRGFAVRHSLEPGLAPAARHRLGDRALRAAVEAVGGYAGDFATVLACRRAARAADVVLSTVDTVGIPLVLLARARVVRTPVVYVSIGLPERLERLRTGAARRLYRDAFRRVAGLVAYGHAEAEALAAWLGPGGPPVRFVPFGVDSGYFAPDGTEPAGVDVVSLGGDPRRDWALLARVAASLPRRSFAAVVPPDGTAALAGAPPNLRVERGVPFAAVRDRLARARVVALPVRDNLYSGATTTLLQALALGKPVVVSRTAAIASGYGLEDGRNCRLVPPGDAEAFARAVEGLLADPDGAAALGAAGRETVERGLTWERYVDALADVVRAAAR